MDFDAEKAEIQQHVEAGNYHTAINIAISAMNAHRRNSDQVGVDHFLAVIQEIVDTMKGEFRWAKNVKPEYFWYNGSIKHLTVQDKIDPSKPVALAEAVGDPSDPNSRIFPFKVHRGKLPYDKVNKTMTILHLFPKAKDDSAAYWKGQPSRQR